MTPWLMHFSGMGGELENEVQRSVIKGFKVNSLLLGFTRHQQCVYDAGRQDKALVIDNGSYHLRAGWSGESGPRLAFPNQIIRPRSRWTNELMTVVGSIGGGVKGYDFGRTAPRSAFDGNVVVNFETQEAVLDYTFDRLSIPGPSLANPVFITECCLNPTYSRAMMAELLFEAYGAPSVLFAADAVCSYAYNMRKGRCKSHGLLLASSHSSTHVLPIVGGKPYFAACQRMKSCGSIATGYLQQLLSLSHPQHFGLLTNAHITEIKHQFTYCSQDFAGELKEIQRSRGSSGNRSISIRIPSPPVSNPVWDYADPVTTDWGRKSDSQNKQPADILEIMLGPGHNVKHIKPQELEEGVVGMSHKGSLLTTEREGLHQGGSKVLESKAAERKKPIFSHQHGDVHESQDQSEQWKRKRVRESQELFSDDSEQSTKRKHMDTSQDVSLYGEKAKLEKRSGDEGKSGKGRSLVSISGRGGKGSEDLSAAQREDFKSIEHHQEDVTKTSGAFSRIDNRPDVVFGPQAHLDFQLLLGVNHIRPPETLFQPSLCGIDQAGVVEVVAQMLKKLPSSIADKCAQGGLLITGGNAALSGLARRLEKDLGSIQPQGKAIEVVPSLDFMLDAWRGASLLADTPGAFSNSFTFANYEEYGFEGLRRVSPVTEIGINPE